MSDKLAKMELQYALWDHVMDGRRKGIFTITHDHHSGGKALHQSLMARPVGDGHPRNVKKVVINLAGSSSVVGAIMNDVVTPGFTPDEVLVDVKEVMAHTDINQEIESARHVFRDLPFKITLGWVGVDNSK